MLTGRFEEDVVAISDSEAESTDSVGAVVNGRPVGRRSHLSVPEASTVIEYKAIQGPILTRIEEEVVRSGTYQCQDVSITMCT